MGPVIFSEGVSVRYCHGHRSIPPWKYPAMGLHTFDLNMYEKYLKHPDWTLMETIALLDYVLIHGANAGAWDHLSEGPVLRVRHRHAHECETRFLHVLVMYSFHFQAKQFGSTS